MTPGVANKVIADVVAFAAEAVANADFQAGVRLQALQTEPCRLQRGFAQRRRWPARSPESLQGGPGRPEWFAANRMREMARQMYAWRHQSRWLASCRHGTIVHTPLTDLPPMTGRRSHF